MNLKHTCFIGVLASVFLVAEEVSAQAGMDNPLSGGVVMSRPGPDDDRIGPPTIPPPKNWNKWRPKKAGLQVDGVEQTQAVQYFRSQLLGSGHPDTEPQHDNAIPLVAHKQTALRYYVSGWVPPLGLGGKISGRLTVSRANQAIMVMEAGPVVAQAGGAVDRGKADQTLNFVLPAEESYGTVKLSLTAELATQRGVVSATTHQTAMTFSENVPQLEMTEILVRRAGQGASMGEVRRMFDAEARKIMPLGNARIVSIQYDYAGAPVKAGTFMLQNQEALRRLAGNSIYVAVLPWSKEEVSDSAPGLGEFSYRGMALYANRLSGPNLSYWLGRVACGLDPLDPGIPAYRTSYENLSTPAGQSLPKHSVGEFGFDGTRVYLPDAADFMHGPQQTGSVRWVSPYHYKRMLACFKSAGS